MRNRTFPVLVSLVLFVCGSPLLASRVRSIALGEMTERAERIFAGRCTEVATVHDEALGQEVTVVTFEVERSLKGETGPALTLRMLGAALAGLPRFEVGQEVILFLRGESAHGLSSPVGLDQGKFTVVEDKQGRRVALNGFGNQGLLRGLPEQAGLRLGAGAHDASRSPGPIAADAFLDAVEWLVGSEEEGR